MQGIAVAGRRMRVATVTVLALLVSMIVPVSATLTATAAGGGTMQVQKTVAAGDDASYGSSASMVVDPTEDSSSVNYRLRLQCDEQDCVDAKLTDALPEALEDFQLSLVTDPTPAGTVAKMYCGESDVTGTVVPVNGQGEPLTVGADCRVEFVFNTDLGGGQVGIASGSQANVTLMFTLPDDLSVDWEFNGEAFPNTATATATGSTDATSSQATTTITIPLDREVEATKDWSPASQVYSPGATSTITLGLGNDSNAAADSLTIQDPKAAADGASSLDASNPFRIADFAGFGTSTAPQGADRAVVSAYVFDAVSSTWGWVEGSPIDLSTGTLELPSGVSNADVGGIRVVYTKHGGELPAGGTAGSVKLDLEQRATERETGTALSDGLAQPVQNVAEGSVTVDGEAATKDASASFTLNGAVKDVEANKSVWPIDDDESEGSDLDVPAGSSAGMTITGKVSESSTVNFSELTLQERDFFDEKVTFGGFTEGLDYPNGADGGKVVWYYEVGGTPVNPNPETTFSDGTTPSQPTPPTGGVLTGFDIIYTSSVGAAIEPGASAAASFKVVTSASTVPAGDDDQVVTYPNTVTVTGETPAGAAGPTASDPVDLNVHYPEIKVDASKKVSPTFAVTPGESVVAELTAVTDGSSGYVSPTQIVIEDSYTSGPSGSTTNPFWDAFNLNGIASTQVPAGTTMKIEYTTGSGWDELDTVGPDTSATSYAKSKSELQSMIPAVPLANITGIRFTFTDDDGYAQNVSVKPVLIFEARSTLRSTGEPTYNPADLTDATSYANTVVVDSQGKVPGTTATLTAEDEDSSADGKIMGDENPPGQIGIDKEWVNKAVNTQSGGTDTSILAWSVSEVSDGSPRVGSVTIADPSVGGETTPANTVFQAFDLTKIEPVPASNVLYSSGWYMKWDLVTSIEVFDKSANSGSGEWVVVTPPSGGWMDANHGFKGYDLSSDNNMLGRDITGVRIVMNPDDAARAATTEAIHPAVGSGIATSNRAREFKLDWKLRNVKRVVASGESKFVTAEDVYNLTGQAGLVRNTSSITGARTNGSTVSDSDSADEKLVDNPPVIGVNKTTSKTSIAIPYDQDVDQSGYPTYSYTVKAWNGSLTNLTHLRVTDPMPCTQTVDCVSSVADRGSNPFPNTYDASSNPFEEVTLTSLSFSVVSAQISKSASQVTLWTYDPATGTTATQTMSITAAEALTASSLENVVGVSVVYQGADPDATGGTILPGTANSNSAAMTLNVQLRKYTRSSSAQTQPVLVSSADTPISNAAFAQGYSTVLYPDSRVCYDTSEPPAQIDCKPGAYGTDAKNVSLTGGTLKTKAAKSYSITSIKEKDRANPFTVTLTGENDSASTLSPNSVEVLDDTAAFWNQVAFNGTLKVTKPNGANQVKVDVKLGDGATWTEGSWVAVSSGSATAVDLPAGVSDSDWPDITGIRVTFNRSDGLVLSNTAPPASWKGVVTFSAKLRDTARDGSAITFGGTTDTVTDTVKVTATHTSTGGSDSKEATKTFQKLPGSFILGVEKSRPAEIVNPGESRQWTLTFRNNGEGYLNVSSLVDTMPDYLEWDGENVTYVSMDAGGTNPGLLSDDAGDITVVYDDTDTSSKTLTFTWPAGQTRMAPGDTMKITLGIILVPGVSALTPVTNSMTVNTDQALQSCTVPSNGRGATKTSTGDGCTTTNFVKADDSSNLSTYKGVLGTSDTVVNTNDPSRACVDKDGYYKEPCAVESTIGGTNTWKIEATNSGTKPATEVVLVDPLAGPGDRKMLSGSQRGSTYHPVVELSSVQLSSGSAAGAGYTVQVSTASDVCGLSQTPTGWSSDPTCDAQPSAWVDVDSYAGAAEDVTALRVVFDLSQLSGGRLAPGQKLGITYQTTNVATQSASDELGPVDPDVYEAAPQRAWNVMGGWAKFTDNSALRNTPSMAGVQLLTGSFVLEKKLDGAGKAYASHTFELVPSCTIGGVTVPVSPENVTISSGADSGTVRVDNVPLGASCSVSEAGTLGRMGESVRTISDPIIVDQVNDAVTGDVPADQTLTVTNTYELTSFKVAKDRTGEGVNLFGDGPFMAEVACTYTQDGVVKDFEFAQGVTSKQIELSAENDYEATLDDLPVGATCDVTETDNGSATSVAYSDPTPLVDVHNAEYPTTATITNTFDIGNLVITKTSTGSGAASYGAGPFNFDVQCTYEGATLYDDTVSVNAGAQKTVGPFPVGTACAVEEVTTGGANEHELSAGSVIIPQVTGGETTSTVTVDATNVFNTGSLEITKSMVGDGAARFGAGPFTAQVTCTRTVDGTLLTVPLADAGMVELGPDNDYTATLGNIPQGSSCAVEETDAGLAVSTELDPSDGVVSIGKDVTATVNIENTFELTSFKVVKQRSSTNGEGVELYGDGPFTANVSCTYEQGGEVRDVEFEQGVTVKELEFSSDNDYEATIDELPVGAECAVTETEDGFATSTTYSPADPADETRGVSEQLVRATSDDAPTTLTIDNRFDIGELVIAKTSTGSGAETYGAGPFGFDVQCTYEGRTLYDDTVSVNAGEQKTVGAFPVGAECAVQEATSGGANAQEISAPSVIIPPLTDGEDESRVVVDATNVFNTGSLSIVKQRVGSGVIEFGAGPFTAQATCTRMVDGVELTVPLDDGGVVTLGKGNGYTATLGNIPQGSSCTVEETNAGLAVDTQLVPEGGAVMIAKDETATVKIINTFKTGKVKVDKQADVSKAQVGDTITYTITVTNTGELDLFNAPVVDALPDGLKYVSAGQGGTYLDGMVTWTIDELKVGQSAEFTISVRVLRTGDIVNRAYIDLGDGPWTSPEYGNQAECGADEDGSCAAIEAVEGASADGNLAKTGEGLPWLVLLGAIVLIGGGAALRRRHSRS